MPRRFLLGTLTVLTLLAAGCLGGDEAPANPLAPQKSPAPTLAFSPALRVDDARPAAEPSIRVAPDGVIWITAPQGLPAGDLVWRSTDGGATFEYMATPDPVFGGGDSDFAIDAGGRLYQTGLWLGCVSLSTSTNGKDWTTNPLACGQPVADRNWIDTHGKDVAYLTFAGGVTSPASTPGSSYVQVVKTALVDPAPVVLESGYLPDSSDYQWPGNIAVDEASGNVYVAYLTVDDKAFVYRSKDGGASWDKLPVSERPGDTFDSFVVVAVDRAGNVYETWSERDGKDRTNVFVAVSADQGETWSGPFQVNTVETAVFPWIVAGDAGRIDLVYYGTSAKGESPETVDGEWHVYLAQSLDALAAAPTFTEARVSDEPVKKGSICTSGTGCEPGTRGLLDYFQVDVDPAGMAHIAWSNNLKDPAVVVYAKQTAGESLYVAGAVPEKDGASGAGALGAVLARLAGGAELQQV